MNKVICVYSSSSWAIDPVYFDAASDLGRQIAEKEDLFLFGGGLTGLMGACARAVHQHHGQVIGIIPEALNIKGIVYDRCDELVVTKCMRERKAIMDERSDAFIALPGGYGTLEEILEIITLKQLRYHNKPIVILNINHFYDKLLEQFETFISQQFAKPECNELYFVTEDISSALDYIDSYEPPVFEKRWLTNVED
ncbi:TIGR00730 family Rossman fold protein [Pelosinus sp. sgz500959]|uniref:LOG family protein n=1 Tax=Pelosinus sp. sgz500959 TaxID=3242472 RepID=UPI00366A5EE0